MSTSSLHWDGWSAKTGADWCVQVGTGWMSKDLQGGGEHGENRINLHLTAA